MIDDTPRLYLEFKTLRGPILFKLLKKRESLFGGDVVRVWMGYRL